MEYFRLMRKRINLFAVMINYGSFRLMRLRINLFAAMINYGSLRLIRLLAYSA